MQARMFREGNYQYSRISKSEARKRFDRYDKVYLLGVNLAIGMMWRPCPISKGIDGVVGSERTFNQHVNEFTYYNCDNERGYYPAFYDRYPKDVTGWMT